MAAEVGAVNFDFARYGRAVRFRRQRFADFVRHHKRGLVLAIQVAAQLQGAMALGAVHEDRDGQKVVAD